MRAKTTATISPYSLSPRWLFSPDGVMIWMLRHITGTFYQVETYEYAERDGISPKGGIDLVDSRWCIEEEDREEMERRTSKRAIQLIEDYLNRFGPPPPFR
jgi:hypothetical protein